MSVTGVLCRLARGTALCLEDQKPAIAKGFFAQPKDVYPQEMFFEAALEDFVIHLEDLENVTFGGNRIGCCGNSSEGPHLFCARNHAVGWERADCWMPHFAFFRAGCVRLVEVAASPPEVGRE